MSPERLTDQEVSRSCASNMSPVENQLSEKIRRGASKIWNLFAGSTALINLIILASSSILLFVFAAISGLFGKIEEWERKNSLSNYHVEEFTILLMVLGIATAIFLFRRYEEMREKSLEETMSTKDTSLFEPRPALQYEELETLFHRVETAKKEWQLSLDSMREMVVLSNLDGTINRCNRAFKDFIGLPYEEILRKNIASLLTEFGIDMKGLDLKALNARFRISEKWFGVRSYSYTDFETNNITRVVIIMVDVSARNLTEDKVQFVWGHTGHSMLHDGQANP
jgi:PAS domain-containing protein